MNLSLPWVSAVLAFLLSFTPAAPLLSALSPEPAPDISTAPVPTPEPEPTPEPTPAPSPTPPPDVSGTLQILMYHHVVEDGGECNDWTVTVTNLRTDLQWLADHGYTTLLPSEVLQGGALPQKAALISFDDGYASNYELAYPILQEFQAKAVISVVTDYVENSSGMFLTWDMCREMAESGLVEIGSHTHNLHEAGIGRLEGESREDYELRVFSDIQTSIDLIQKEVGTAPCFFAYPHGLAESWASDFLAGRFAMSVTTTYGPAKVSRGLYNLPRYNISYRCRVSALLRK